MKRKIFSPKPVEPGADNGFWVNMDSMERIRAKCDHSAKLQALYYILNLLMSDAQARTFPATYAQLSQRAGIKLGAIKRHLSGLEYCGVIVTKEQPDKESALITITGNIKLK